MVRHTGACLGAITALMIAVVPSAQEVPSAQQVPAAQEAYPAAGSLPAQPEVAVVYNPIPPDRLDQMVPKHPGYLGALAPENLSKERPAPAFDITGTWFIDLSEGFQKYKFGPPYPNFGAEGREALIEAPKARARGETYRDAIGQCYPPGMPMLMTRVWPHAFIQLPTAIYIISGFNNSVRTIFLDGRDFSDPDLVVPSYNGESIGHWEGETLVVRSRYFETDNHYVDLGIPISEAFELVERIHLIADGGAMEVEYTLTDPEMWKGEWRSIKRYNRQDYTDINEAVCITHYNANLPGTELGSEAATERGQSAIEGATE